MSEIDKNQLYGRYQQHEDKRNNLALKVAHKALDIPVDDMNINQRTINNGMSGKALIGAVLATGLAAGAGTLGMAHLLTPAVPAITSKVESPATGTPAPATAYDAIYETQQPDGSWKLLRREHLKP